MMFQNPFVTAGCYHCQPHSSYVPIIENTVRHCLGQFAFLHYIIANCCIWIVGDSYPQDVLTIDHRANQSCFRKTSVCFRRCANINCTSPLELRINIHKLMFMFRAGGHIPWGPAGELCPSCRRTFTEENRRGSEESRLSRSTDQLIDSPEMMGCDGLMSGLMSW